MFVVIFSLMAMAAAGPTTETYKDQYCTDPRTMQKHLAYTEWADAYSCTRHRCQPGGRNLAIYTVGCKRVEAPESAIECEEVVEDTNMQFPYCCTRLRCLVVVRGEVWTRVLGQPWETLPAAPWSHMYKMKKPPPGENTFLPKNPSSGPIYELASDSEGGKVLRASKKGDAASPDCNEVAPRSVPTPDIVIALSTNNDLKDTKKSESSQRHKRVRKLPANGPLYEEDPPQEHHNEVENDDPMPTEKEMKPQDAISDEKYYSNAYGVTQKPYNKNQHHQVSWTEVPPTQWNEREHDTPTFDVDTMARDGNHPSEFPPLDEKPTLKEEKPTNLQALVDAIGTRMRDIENVVQRMSEKVHHAKTTTPDYISGEKGALTDIGDMPGRKRHKEMKEHATDRTKRPNPDGDTYKRFSVRNRGSKYLHTGTDTTTDQPLFIEDNNMNGYFSDASNSVMRRSNTPKLREPRQNATSGERIAPEVLEEREETHIAHANCNHTSYIEPQLTYMAPVETRRKSTHIMQSDASEEVEKKKKKHSHKKKKGKGRSHKKHHKEEKKKKALKTNSAEVERNVVSLEDSSALTNK